MDIDSYKVVRSGKKAWFYHGCDCQHRMAVDVVVYQAVWIHLGRPRLAVGLLGKINV